MTDSGFNRQLDRLTSHLRIRAKLIAVSLFISLASVTAIALVVNYQTSKILVETVETDLRSHATNEGIAVGNLLLHQIELLQSLSLNEILINKATLANILHGNDFAAIQAEFSANDREWKTAVETDRLAQIVLTNSTADELRAFRARFPDHMEIFITDRYGGLLAATNMTTDYYQADEAWWQHAYDEGNGRPVIELPQYDESTQILGLALAVPIYDRDQTVIGILRTTYDLQTLGELIRSPTIENDQLLFDILFPNNQMVSTETLLQNRYEEEGETAVIFDESSLDNLRKNTFAPISLNGKTYLAGLSRVTTIDHNPVITSLEWMIMARQERQLALALVTSQRRTIWLLAVLVMGFAIVGALFSSQYLTRPIRSLTDVAQQIRDGNLNVQAPIASNDEIGELAETFNDMTERLRHVIARLEENREQLEQRVAERTAEIEQQSKMLDVILSTTPTYFFVYNQQEQFIYASPPALAAIGLTSCQLAKKTQETLTTFFPEYFSTDLAQVLQTGQPKSNEFQIAHPQQSQQFEYTLNPFYDNEGLLSSIVVTVRNITEQKLAQEALWHSQKMESLGILAGGVAHDFNNLLVALIGQTSLALRKMPPDAPAQKHLDKAMKAAERAADLTKQMLAYSGKGRFDLQPIRLNQLIHENSHLFEAVVSKKIRLQLNLSDQLPLFDGNPGQMQQIVMNLLLNAAEAIGENDGQVLIATCMQAVTADDDRFWQKTNDPLTPGDYVCLRVQDDGIGMDYDRLSKIFDPFFTTKFTGRGLGLAAVLGIVRGHKGGLYVTSQPNVGTTFELVFPATSQGEVEGVEETAVSLPQSISGALLVIDDEAPVREATIDILEMENIHVFTAANGEAGIALYQKQRESIDLILLDLSMPGLSGHETFQALKQINPQAKIILSSGYSEEEIHRQFAGEDVTDFLAKPYKLATLVQKVHTYIE